MWGDSKRLESSTKSFLHHLLKTIKRRSMDPRETARHLLRYRALLHYDGAWHENPPSQKGPPPSTAMLNAINIETVTFLIELCNADVNRTGHSSRESGNLVVSVAAICNQGAMLEAHNGRLTCNGSPPTQYKTTLFKKTDGHTRRIVWTLTTHAVATENDVKTHHATQIRDAEARGDAARTPPPLDRKGTGDKQPICLQM